MIGVVLAMYNGENFILDQLNSILHQTLLPDEVLIVDDCSTDDSFDIVHNFIEENNLKWQIKKNSFNKGWKKTFNETLSDVKSEFVLFCDQDDIWYENKIEETIKAIKASNALVVCSNYSLLYSSDKASKVLNKEEKKLNNNGLLWQVKKINDFYIKRPGCSMCISREAIEIASPFLKLEYPHDAIFWKLAFLENRLFILNKSLFKRRRHENNASTVKKQTAASRQAEIENEFKYAQVLNTAYSRNHIVQNFLKMCSLRKKFFDTKNIFYWIRLIVYSKFYVSFKSYLGDFIICYLR